MFRTLWANTKSILYTVVAVSVLLATCLGGLVLVPILIGAAIVFGIFAVFKEMQD